MDKIDQALDDMLLRYLDGTLSATEKQSMDKDIATNEGMKKRLDQLQTMHTLMHANKFEHPAKNFTSVVMTKLSQGPARASSFPIRNGIFLLAGVLLVAIIGAILVPAGVFDSITTTIDLNQVELAKKYIELGLPSISLTGKVMVNLIIGINLVIGWIVLDRAILKPIFQRRMQEGH